MPPKKPQSQTKKNSEGKTYKCEYCGFVYQHYSSMFEHIKVKHKERYEKPHVCPELSCDATFKNKWYFNRHIKTVHKKEEFRNGNIHCELCNRDFCASGSLSRHMKNIHKNAKGNKIILEKETNFKFPNGFKAQFFSNNLR